MIRQAVSCVLTCNEQVYLIKRQNYLRAFPGYWAFPGGKVDKKDKESFLDKTLFNALVREIHEELGIDLNKLEESKEVSIKKIAKATSPDFNPYRYETYFYQVEFKSIPDLIVDKTEVLTDKWDKANSFLQKFQQGEYLMVAPIRRILKQIADKNLDFIDYDQAREARYPMIEPLGGLYQYMPLSNTVPPATRTNCFIFGDLEKVMIDPSPKDKNEYRQFIKQIKELDIKKVIISHHHPDHHEYAPDICRELNLPLMISEDSYNRLLVKKGKDYFGDISVTFLEENQEITRWHDYPVKAIHIPGHDEGHYGFCPDNLAWFIVGDLFQGVGTVVVGGDEGDMTKYLNSLQKIIDLKPGCVIPSHGIALGGVHILEKTYEHRMERERQVSECLALGMDIEQILDKLYFDIPDKIRKYARANIESHIKRLNQN